MTRALPSVALVGKQGSGKTTIAERLVRDHGYIRHSWATGVRHIFEMAYDTITPENYATVKGTLYETTVHTDKGREKILRTGGELLQLIGAEAIRQQVDQDFWVKAGIRRMLPRWTVSDDTRYLNEAEALRGRGWVIVRVNAPDAVRRARIGSAFRPENHSSETEQEMIAEDFNLLNDDGGIEQTMKTLVEFLSSVDNSFMSRAERALSDGVI